MNRTAWMKSRGREPKFLYSKWTPLKNKDLKVNMILAPTDCKYQRDTGERIRLVNKVNQRKWEGMLFFVDPATENITHTEEEVNGPDPCHYSHSVCHWLYTSG